ncbi:MAG TPA: hypothetical protein VHJ17_09165 [Thermomonospora sp.]|nr:hypothetical protein [Thermomonospora sp.]
MGDRAVDGEDGSPAAAVTAALAMAGVKAEVLHDVTQATVQGTMACVECRVDGVTRWGAGQGGTGAEALAYAVASAVNRARP